MDFNWNWGGIGIGWVDVDGDARVEWLCGVLFRPGTRGVRESLIDFP